MSFSRRVTSCSRGCLRLAAVPGAAGGALTSAIPQRETEVVRIFFGNPDNIIPGGEPPGPEHGLGGCSAAYRDVGNRQFCIILA